MKTVKLYGVLIKEEPDSQYWVAYESLEEVTREYEGEEVFEFSGKSIGKFRLEVVQKVQRSRKKKTN